VNAVGLQFDGLESSSLTLQPFSYWMPSSRAYTFSPDSGVAIEMILTFAGLAVPMQTVAGRRQQLPHFGRAEGYASAPRGSLGSTST
jgi:hypothetical protein